MEGSASYKRLQRHPQNSKIFLPINIDGIETADHFITVPKLVTIGAIGFLLVAIVVNSLSGGINMFLGILIWLLLSSFAARYIIFEERRYYKAYLQTKKVEVCTPAEFFKVTSVRDTPGGAVIMFNSGLVGLLVRLERGTVVGRPADFVGEHYDAMSEMYRQLLKAGLKFVSLDVCESSGNESTVDALGRLTVNSSNRNINKLLELQVGYIKTLVNDTIYTRDYILIYTEAARIGTLISESEEALRMSLEGAIDGYEFLNEAEMSVFVSEYFGVGFFSGGDVLRRGVVRKAFKVVGAEYDDGVKLTIGDDERAKLDKQVKGVSEGKFVARDVSLRKAVAAGGAEFQGFRADIPQSGTGVLFDASATPDFRQPSPGFPQSGQISPTVPQPAPIFPAQTPFPQQGQPIFPGQTAPTFPQQGFPGNPPN
ncbi:hypothetical protein FACS1894208_00460 [Clostridia bacterium]|nr:hypothetical protein FACS1894208_00460 [Clostridia bacterium]